MFVCMKIHIFIHIYVCVCVFFFVSCWMEEHASPSTVIIWHDVSTHQQKAWMLFDHHLRNGVVSRGHAKIHHPWGMGGVSSEFPKHQVPEHWATFAGCVHLFLAPLDPSLHLLQHDYVLLFLGIFWCHVELVVLCVPSVDMTLFMSPWPPVLWYSLFLWKGGGDLSLHPEEGHTALVWWTCLCICSHQPTSSRALSPLIPFVSKYLSPWRMMWPWTSFPWHDPFSPCMGFFSQGWRTWNSWKTCRIIACWLKFEWDVCRRLVSRTSLPFVISSWAPLFLSICLCVCEIACLWDKFCFMGKHICECFSHMYTFLLERVIDGVNIFHKKACVLLCCFTCVCEVVFTQTRLKKCFKAWCLFGVCTEGCVYFCECCCVVGFFLVPVIGYITRELLYLRSAWLAFCDCVCALFLCSCDVFLHVVSHPDGCAHIRTQYSEFHALVGTVLCSAGMREIGCVV